MFEREKVFVPVLTMCAMPAGEQRLRETKEPVFFPQVALLHAWIALPIEAVLDNTAGLL